MPETFLVADTHFGHEKVCTSFKTPDGRPLRPYDSAEEMNEKMVELWNETVRPNDLVYHLGDVTINHKHLSILDRLNGRKRLIMGNHDNAKPATYLNYFQRIYCSYVFDGFLATHIPVHESQLERFGYNVHGHLHANKLEDPRYLCVSVEHTDFKPIPLYEVRKRLSRGRP